MPRHKDDPALSALARILRGLRVQRGLEEGRAHWIAAKVAERSGTTLGTVSSSELGSMRPSRDVLVKLLDGLRADPATREEALRLHAASVEASTAAARAALQERKDAHPRVTACARFRAGESVGSIAASMGLREQQVKSWLWGAGLRMPRPEGKSVLIQRELDAGESPGTIAAKLSCSRQHVYQTRYRSASRGLVFDRAAFRGAMAKAGYRSAAALARAIGSAPGYCALVARGMVPSPETRAKIAAALGVPGADLWVPTIPRG